MGFGSGEDPQGTAHSGFSEEQSEKLAKKIVEQYDQLVNNKMTSDEAFKRILDTIQEFNKLLPEMT